MKSIKSDMDMNFPQYSLKLIKGKPVEVEDAVAKKLLKLKYITEAKPGESSKDEKAKCPKCLGTNVHHKDGCLDCKTGENK
jgi:hypothetical protein